MDFLTHRKDYLKIKHLRKRFESLIYEKFRKT